MSGRFLPYGHQSISEEDIAAVVEVLRGDWLTTGPAVGRFERDFADYVGARYAVSFSSGTAALHGAMHAAGVRDGDSVAVPALTFAATSNAALYCGGRPIFAEIDEGTYCLSPEATARAIRAHGGPVRAIAPVSFAGLPVDIAAFRAVADECGAVLIEDAAHALGAERAGRRVGAEADMTAFSFHPVKHITTGEGGMVTTNSESLARSLRLFRNHGIAKEPGQFRREPLGGWDCDMVELGFNYRLSDISCALGASQLRRSDEFAARRREIAALYRELLSGTEGLTLPPDAPGHSYHLFAIRTAPERRREVFDRLRKAGIGVQVHYNPVYAHSYYRENFPVDRANFPVTERVCVGLISMPIWIGLTDDEVRRAANELKEALAGR